MEKFSPWQTADKPWTFSAAADERAVIMRVRFPRLFIQYSTLCCSAPFTRTPAQSPELTCSACHRKGPPSAWESSTFHTFSSEITKAAAVISPAAKAPYFAQQADRLRQELTAVAYGHCDPLSSVLATQEIVHGYEYLLKELSSWCAEGQNADNAYSQAVSFADPVALQKARKVRQELWERFCQEWVKA